MNLLASLMLAAAVALPNGTTIGVGDNVSIGQYAVNPARGVYYNADCYVSAVRYDLTASEDIPRRVIHDVIERMYLDCMADTNCGPEDINGATVVWPNGLALRCDWRRVDF